jgi:hypothetical protein
MAVENGYAIEAIVDATAYKPKSEAGTIRESASLSNCEDAAEGSEEPEYARPYFRSDQRS